jgi:hypothetical protein
MACAMWLTFTRQAALKKELEVIAKQSDETVSECCSAAESV